MRILVEAQDTEKGLRSDCQAKTCGIQNVPCASLTAVSSVELSYSLLSFLFQPSFIAAASRAAFLMHQLLIPHVQTPLL